MTSVSLTFIFEKTPWKGPLKFNNTISISKIEFIALFTLVDTSVCSHYKEVSNLFLSHIQQMVDW